MGISKNDLIETIEKYRKIDISQNTIELLEIVENFINDNSKDIVDYENSKIRFCDYYSVYMHGDELIDFFRENYEGDDKEKNMNLFLVYCIFKSTMDLLELYELEISLEDAKSMEECLIETKNDINYLISLYKHDKTNTPDDIVDLSFINENKYSIFFTGAMEKDIQKLPKFVLRALIKKLKGDFTNEDIIRGAESVSHVKDRYNVPLLRVQLSDDYRVAFIRTKGTTMLFGTELKSGKNNNYTRYDSFMERIDEIYEELDESKNGKLDENSTHRKVTQYLGKFLLKERKKEIEDKHLK